jgi:hypothetical protein
MEETIQATPVQIEQQLAELAPLQVIRTETALSKLPIHNLAKKGNVDINIVRKNKNGEIDLQWIVSYSDRYGQPRQVGYKLDTIVINRRIDEAGRPSPELIRLGSLREIALELGLGSDTASVRKALLQNSSAYITARLKYTAIDKRQRTLEAGFSRYSVIFTGDELPSGEKADAVYIELNARYQEVLNNALFRPLNYDYMRELSPAAQRFYEVVSRSIFAALKHQHAEARLSYSEYCTCSAQQRYYDYNRFKKQMYKIHRPHLASGYLKAVRYETTKDGDGKIDWDMFYTPGPKAKAEHHTFTKSGRVIDSSPEIAHSEVAFAPRVSRPRSASQQRRFFSFSPAPTLESEPSVLALAELRKRGIGEGKARALLTRADPELIIDQLEWGDHQIRAGQGTIRNPAGFYIHLVEQKITPPEDFLTSRRTKSRELARQAKHQEQSLRYEREEAYRAANNAAVDRHIAAHIRTEDMERLATDQVAELRKDSSFKHLPPQTIQEIALRKVRQAIAQELHLPTFEEFCAKLDIEGNTATDTDSLTAK